MILRWLAANWGMIALAFFAPIAASISFRVGYAYGRTEFNRAVARGRLPRSGYASYIGDGTVDGMADPLSGEQRRVQQRAMGTINALRTTQRRIAAGARRIAGRVLPDPAVSREMKRVARERAATRNRLSW